MAMSLVYLKLLGNISIRKEFDRRVTVYEATARMIFVECHLLSKDTIQIVEKSHFSYHWLILNPFHPFSIRFSFLLLNM